jgi:hypothetical protein
VGDVSGGGGAGVWDECRGAAGRAVGDSEEFLVLRDMCGVQAPARCKYAIRRVLP